MVAIAATSYATPSSPLVMQTRVRLEAARREADQAEANARELRAQAEQAEQEAQKGQSRVTSLSAQALQTDSTYASQIRRQASASEARRTQDFLAPVAAVAANNYSFPQNPLKPSANTWSLVNQQGATIGRLLNLSA